MEVQSSGVIPPNSEYINFPLAGGLSFVAVVVKLSRSNSSHKTDSNPAPVDSLAKLASSPRTSSAMVMILGMGFHVSSGSRVSPFFSFRG
jgi:hypothetical protein